MKVAMPKYRPQFWIILALTEAVIIAAALILAFAIDAAHERETARLHNRIDTLEDHIAEIKRPTGTGGAEKPLRDADPAYLWPVAPEDYTIMTSPYGVRESPFSTREVRHAGVDIAGVWRARIVAVDSGEVVEHWPPPGTPYPGGGEYRGHEVYGGMILIRHDDGTESLYAHMSWTRVHEDMRVEAGEVIGRMGNTGKSDGRHLHFELTRDGELVNPLRYVRIPTNE